MPNKRLYIYLLFLRILLQAPLALAVGDTLQLQSETPDQVEYLVLSDYEENKVPVFTSDWKEKYQGKEFQYVELEYRPGFFERLMKWLSKKLGVKTATQNSQEHNVIFEIIAYILLAVTLVMVALHLSKTPPNSRYRRNSRLFSEHEETIQNIQPEGFDQLIAKTIEDKNYRLAVRYYYLWALRQFNEKGLLERHQDKTNSEYLREISNRELRDDFAYNCYLYEYIWYGNFEVNAEDYQKAEKAFQRTLNQLS